MRKSHRPLGFVAFYSRMFSRAFWEFAEVMGNNKQTYGFVGGTLVIAGIMAYETGGRESLLKEFDAEYGGYVALAGLIIGIVLIACGFVQAPHREHVRQFERAKDIRKQYRKMAGIATQLRGELNRKAINLKLAEQLAHEDTWAIDNLWAARPQSSDSEQFRVWVDNQKKWKRRLLAILENHNVPYLDYKHVWKLGDIGDRIIVNYDAEINRQLKMVAVRRQRLDDLIKKYSA